MSSSNCGSSGTVNADEEEEVGNGSITDGNVNNPLDNDDDDDLLPSMTKERLL